MERKKGWIKVRRSRILWVVMAVLLCAAPCIWAEVIVIDGPETGPLFISGMVDILTGADITGGLYITPESIVNIYGGNVGGEGIVLVQNGTDPIVFVHGTNFAVDGVPLAASATEFTVNPYDGGTLTGTYENGYSINLLFHSNIPINLVNTGTPPPPQPINVEIDIKPGSDDNTINLGSNGVIPVAILSTPDFDATTAINPDNVFLAGSSVAVRGKGNKSLASQEDVNGDGLMDLVVKVETENLDPGTFQDGIAILEVIVDNTVVYEGSDSINIVPPE